MSANSSILSPVFITFPTETLFSTVFAVPTVAFLLLPILGKFFGHQTKVFAGLQCSKDVFIQIHPVLYQPPQWTVPPISAFLPPRQCWVEHHRHQFKSLSCNPRALTRLIPEHQYPCICQARERSLYNKYQLTIHCQRPLLLLAGCPQLPLNYLHTILYLHPRLDVWKVEPWPLTQPLTWLYSRWDTSTLLLFLAFVCIWQIPMLQKLTGEILLTSPSFSLSNTASVFVDLV